MLMGIRTLMGALQRPAVAKRSSITASMYGAVAAGVKGGLMGVGAICPPNLTLGPSPQSEREDPLMKRQP